MISSWAAWLTNDFLAAGRRTLPAGTTIRRSLWFGDAARVSTHITNETANASASPKTERSDPRSPALPNCDRFIV
jgi:hypothetical protein